MLKMLKKTEKEDTTDEKKTRNMGWKFYKNRNFVLFTVESLKSRIVPDT